MSSLEVAAPREKNGEKNGVRLLWEGVNDGQGRKVLLDYALTKGRTGNTWQQVVDGPVDSLLEVVLEF